MTIDLVRELIPSFEIIVLCDFNDHGAERLGSRTTDLVGRSVYDFTFVCGLTQLVSSPTRMLNMANLTEPLLYLRFGIQTTTNSPLQPYSGRHTTT
ncbi:hypothetical protein EVAR_16246_1 [Eumeta japonica]|uniref:Endonuclease/exonuclease/phosphatase domain-containing protein n=1 Tax=Eumeta variegata TaxID=151549 RepID=A0A4C1U6H5_EUMVA|nr:hypothetical protein EVAR_16246_1 [Eumeta japonica]